MRTVSITSGMLSTKVHLCLCYYTYDGSHSLLQFRAVNLCAAVSLCEAVDMTIFEYNVLMLFILNRAFNLKPRLGTYA